jgi:hypothetical protein
MQLPESLQPWRDWLDWFSGDLATEMGELVFRLHPLLGRYRGGRQKGTAEPDGLGDLHKRGSYERLLSSEWLIAEEVPEEFIRRATTGEHLFLAPRPRAQETEKLIVALFDSGPLQLGAPRLVQLAMWILLARRAREVGGTLLWGVLQAEPALQDANSPEHLRQLLKARRFEAVHPTHYERWQKWIAEEALRPGELWLLGAEQAASMVQQLGASHQLIASLDILTDGLDVQIKEGVANRRLVLPLPDKTRARRIFEGIFQAGDRAPMNSSGGSPCNLSITLPPVLSLAGGHVAVPLLDESGVMVFNIPQKAIHRPGKARQQLLPKQFKPLAFSFIGKTLGILLSGNDQLCFHQLGKHRVQQRPPREQFEAPPGQAHYLPAARLYGAPSPGSERFYVLDRGGRLVYWQGKAKDSPVDESLYLHASDVLAMAQIHSSQLVYISNERGSLVVHRLGSGHTKPWYCWLNNTASVKEVLFGAGILWRAGFGACGLRIGDDSAQHWMIYAPSLEAGQNFHILEISLPNGWRAIGLVHLPEESSFALLALNPVRNQLVLCSTKARETLYACSAAVTRYCVCPVNGLVAMTTLARQLIVYDVPARNLRMTIDGRGSDHADT